MASGQTNNYELNQWSAEDPVLREEFNRDNEKVDVRLEQINTTMPRVVVGSYEGNGSDTESVTVTLSFKPKAVLVWCNYYDSSSGDVEKYNGMAIEGQPLGNGILTLLDSGFEVKSTKSSGYQAYPYLNANHTYFYVAVG